MADGSENVVISVPGCSVTVLPALGGKISSICVGSQELLQKPLHPRGPRNQTMSFEESDAGGWDECLPSVAACSIETAAGTANIPDHGDLWRVPWELLEATNDSVTMRARCFSLPLVMTRTMLLTSTANGWRLQVLYSLTNHGIYTVPWSWAAHPLFTCLPGDRLSLPAEIKSLRLEGSRDQRLGSGGSMISWPLAKTQGGSSHDLSLAYAPDAGFGDKLFAGPVGEAWCTLHRPSVGLDVTTRFDPAITPWIGLWLCYGGWPENGDGPHQVCIAPEPTTAPVDSLAETGEWSRSLEAGETVNWPMEVTIEKHVHPSTLSAKPG